jgi:hypothetical protein
MVTAATAKPKVWRDRGTGVKGRGREIREHNPMPAAAASKRHRRPAGAKPSRQS